MARSNNLEKYREAAGLTKTELSHNSGMSVRTIQRVENEKREVTEPTKHKLVAGLNKSNHKPREFSFEEVFPSHLAL